MTRRKLLLRAAFTQRGFCKEELLHREAQKRSNFYTQRLWYKDTFAHGSFYTKKLYTEELSHIEAGTQRDFYTLCAETFTHRRTFTRQELLHVDFIDFYTKNFYSTQRTLHAETFIHRNLYTQRNVYARELLRKDASTHTQNSFYA